MTETSPALNDYDYIIVAMSTGKDSLACHLKLVEDGADPSKIEWWHHDVDGQEGSTLMDWGVTRQYAIKLAEALGVPLYFSWKEGGFEREMCRDGAPTARNHFETPTGLQSAGGNSVKTGTRRKFPQCSADLSVRWCSAYLKIDVASTAINNQSRFLGKRTLFVTGERAQESAARAKYKTFEPHRTDLRHSARRYRHVDHWRPIHAWSEEQVWEIIRRHGVVTHPAYSAGFGRVSCMNCIFMSHNQAATIQAHAPERLNKLATYERDFGCTIHRSLSVLERADKGTPYAAATPEAMRLCLQEEFDGPIKVDPAAWALPAGAFGESCGPT
ncbi:MAG: phosphoadenosine phosphosulfate reductase [Stutzerimonas stutzeri]|nr:MAG: phosphoadenosine phosphosulfate reductase [Stutzerimonas stutzeri]